MLESKPYYHGIVRMLLTLALISLLIGCSAGEDTPPPSKENAALVASSTAKLITTTQATRKAIIHTQTSIGTVIARHTPTIAAETAGRVTQIPVDIGDQIKPDQILVTLDDTLLQIALKNAQAQVSRLKALLSNQQLTTGRLTALVNKGTVAQSRLDEAQAQNQSLDAQLTQARQGVKEAQYHLDKARIRSPIAGAIQHIAIDVGDYVVPGTPIMTIVDNQALRAELAFPESVRPMLHIGQAVTLQSRSAPNAPIKATITKIKPSLDQSNRAAIVIVDFSNPGSWDPGSSVTGHVSMDQSASDMLLVPETSLVQQADGYIVFVVTDNHVKARAVTIGAHSDGFVEITQGLSHNDIIANEGAQSLSDGALIRVSAEGNE